MANFFGIIVVFDHAVNIISQFAVILDVLNAARMYFVTHAFGWTMLTLEHISQTLIFVVLKLETFLFNSSSRNFHF